MILGHGVDVQSITAVAKVVERQARFPATILTTAEMALYDRKRGKHQNEFLTGRFSAKEAFSKAIGTGMSQGLGWHDLEIVTGESGEPVFVKYPNQEEIRVHVSISHSADTVFTSVILEREDER
ncbi:holo-ACP synthase [Weissella tructae]|jgi:holo-[acyl-carrier-protein] synthase|uniref:Holo-[acyl-carrier-protein] synthase n=2 Tax=Weissella TaxID=46255 RepID=A0A075TYK7_9LACO|nr:MULTISPECIES: holo-ACP synthase [Weissella]AIG65003.1 Alanine racemase [Weissella tructae]AIM62315.1 Alanine racemase [Weissella ceti]AIM63654.1 Alanine racemase [Weissella ceti]ELA07805.1 alanine racemase [Weissella ceti NC36]